MATYTTSVIGTSRDRYINAYTVIQHSINYPACSCLNIAWFHVNDTCVTVCKRFDYSKDNWMEDVEKTFE